MVSSNKNSNVFYPQDSPDRFDPFDTLDIFNCVS